MNIEKRSASGVKANGRKLVGYVATFGNETRIGDFREKIAPGAFAGSLASGRDILALVDHDHGKVLARSKSGSLKIYEDAQGLAFEIELPETQAGRDVLALAERGDLGGMSFGFSVPTGGDSWSGDLRELRSVVLFEVSVIQSFPAYGDTSVSLRSRRNDTQRRLALLELEGGNHVAIH